MRRNWYREWVVGRWKIEVEWLWLARYFSVCLIDTVRQAEIDREAGYGPTSEGE